MTDPQGFWHRPKLLNAMADLLMLAGLAALLWVGVLWVMRLPSLPIRQVVFAQELTYTKRLELEQVLPAAVRGNFFNVNLDVVRATLEELPWVRRAEVRRVWPARIEVRVEEHQPVARWGEGRGEMLNSHGEVFAASFAEIDRLPLLQGPPGTSLEVLRRFGEFTQMFVAMNERPVSLLLSSRLAWQMELSNGMVVDLGREQPKSPIARRLERFVAFFPEAVARGAGVPEVVDLRYPNGFAMRGGVEGERKVVR